MVDIDGNDNIYPPSPQFYTQAIGINLDDFTVNIFLINKSNYAIFFLVYHKKKSIVLTEYVINITQIYFRKTTSTH